MTKRRFAIITYYADWLADLNWQAEGNSFAYAIWRGLNGYTYAKERGVIDITVLDQVPALPAPNDHAKRWGLKVRRWRAARGDNQLSSCATFTQCHQM